MGALAQSSEETCTARMLALQSQTGLMLLVPVRLSQRYQHQSTVPSREEYVDIISDYDPSSKLSLALCCHSLDAPGAPDVYVFIGPVLPAGSNRDSTVGSVPLNQRLRRGRRSRSSTRHLTCVGSALMF